MKEKFDMQQLLKFAEEGRLTKHALGTMLVPEARRQFLESCAALEKQYTNDCAATNDPCLESGCPHHLRAIAPGHRSIHSTKVPWLSTTTITRRTRSL